MSNVIRRGYAHKQQVEVVAPPHDLDAEISVLGSILLQSTAIEKVRPFLKPEDFYRDSYGQIYRIASDLFVTGIPIDNITLGAALQANGLLDRVGGRAELALMQGAVPTAANVEHYGRIVAEKALRRRVISQGHELVRRAADDAVDAPELVRAALSSLSAVEGSLFRAETNLFRSARELLANAPENAPWIAAPFLAVGAITELAGSPKIAGKTTFFLNLARAVIAEELFLARSVVAQPVVYLTEERNATFAAALRRAGLADCDGLTVMSWAEVAHRLTWPEVVAAAGEECARIGSQVLIVDTLSRWAGLASEKENDAGAALEAMRPLADAAAKGLAVLVGRHERKSGGALGEAARGSSAFTGEVDIVVSLRRPPGAPRPTVREIRMIGRFPDLPDGLVIELSPDGKTYQVLGSHETMVVDSARQMALQILSGEAEALTMDNLLTEIAACGKQVSRSSLQLALKDAVEGGGLKRLGKGKRGDPYRWCRAESDDSDSADGYGETVLAERKLALATRSELTKESSIVRVAQFSEEWQLQDRDGLPLGVGTFDSLEAATGFASANGWSVVAAS